MNFYKRNPRTHWLHIAYTANNVYSRKKKSNCFGLANLDRMGGFNTQETTSQHSNTFVFPAIDGNNKKVVKRKNQMIKNRPGPKPKPEGTTKVRHNVMLSPSVAEAARQLGNGNLSAGIALAVEQAKKSPH